MEFVIRELRRDPKAFPRLFGQPAAGMLYSRMPNMPVSTATVSSITSISAWVAARPFRYAPIPSRRDNLYNFHVNSERGHSIDRLIRPHPAGHISDRLRVLRCERLDFDRLLLAALLFPGRCGFACKRCP